MTEQETIKIITLIVMSYPSNDKFKDEANIKGMVAVWKNIFKDDDYTIVETSLHKHISTNKWPPSIAEIREQMVSLTRPDLIPPDIAWSAVEDVIATEGEFMYGDIYALLPELIARVVETIGWSKLYNLHCGSFRGNPDGLDRVAFMDLYKPAYEREKELSMLPKALKNIVETQKRRIGGDSIKMLETAKTNRQKKTDFYDRLSYPNQKLIQGGKE